MKKLLLCGFLICSGICFFQYKNPMEAFLVILFLLVLTCVAFQDWNTKTISNRWISAILLLAVGSVFAMPEVTLVERIVGMLCISVPMLVLTILVPGAFGGGDVKLMAACGLFFGWRDNILATVLAIFMGGLYGIWLLLGKRKERKTVFAFGPFLCAGMAIAVLWGDEMIKWFLG